MGTSGVTTAPPADVLVAGLPGPLMDWTFDLIGRAATATYAAVSHLPIGGDAYWTPPGPAGARLFSGDFLQEDWAAYIRAGRIAAVLVLDDPAAVWDRLTGFGQSPAEATQNMIAVATSFGDVAGSAAALTIRSPDLADPAGLAHRILAHLGLSPAAADVWEPPAPPPQTAIAADTRAIIEPAFAYGATCQRMSVTWPRHRLFWGDSPGNPLPRILDLTGPSRILAYGPYLALPPGRWTMTAVIALSPSSRGAILALGLYNSNELGRIVFTAESPGLFKATVPVVVDSPRNNLEIRLVSERGAIEGTIGIDDIVFTPE